MPEHAKSNRVDFALDGFDNLLQGLAVSILGLLYLVLQRRSMTGRLIRVLIQNRSQTSKFLLEDLRLLPQRTLQLLQRARWRQ